MGERAERPLHEAWARFKEMLRKCPHHGISLLEQFQTFYYGLISSTKTLVNTAVGCTVLTKTPSEFHALLEELARSNNQYSVEMRLMKDGPATAHATTSGGDAKAMKEMFA